MAYPNPTTYTLPFMDRIRVSSRCRFVLVRDNDRGTGTGTGAVNKPFIVRRSNTLTVLVADYNPATDYLIDQAWGTITYHFNGRKEITNV